ncbi:MAG: hypothetical protein DHS20C18_05380 [Saprospiraceae bacterium]|nr:MAG: hypothetical protein DHS20C18_05380 [Saprospiraceae bacterium]
MSWTEQKIRNFAADALTFDRARGIFFGNRWLSLHGNEHLIWGEYPAGSGRTSGPVRTYRTVVDTADERYHCSCTSRIVPCKHILALMLQLLRRGDSFFVTYEQPDWVAQWLQPTDKSKQKDKISKEELAHRAVQQQKTRDKRFLQMQAGVDELENWLIDLLNQGIASLDGQDARFWDEFAARLVNAKLSGPARRVRLMNELQGTEHWHDKVLRELADLYLFVRAFRRIEYLPPALQRDLLTMAGVSTKQAEVLQETGLKDRWLVCGQTEGVEERLNFRRTWLLGEKSGHFALLLDFSWGNQGYPTQWVTGKVLEGVCLFYPSAYPQRALLQDFNPSTTPFQSPPACPSLTDFGDEYARALAANPWIKIMPLLLEEAIPMFRDGKFYVVDQSAKQVLVHCDPVAGWKMIALSGGRPISIFGEWDGQLFSALAVLNDEKLVAL